MTAPHMSRRDFDRTLADLLLQAWATPMLAHLLGLGLVFLLLRDTLPMSVFLPWAGAVTAIVAVRAVVWRIASRRTWSPRAVRLTARVMLFALGLAWGVGTAVAAQHMPFARLAILLVALVGLGTAGAGVLVADRWVYPLYSVTLFAAVSVGVALETPNREGFVAIAIIVAFVAFSVQLHRQAHRTLLENLTVTDALRTRESQFAEAQQIAHVGSWDLNLATNHVTWSDEHYRLCGIPIGSPVGYELFLSLIHPDDRARVEELVGKSLAQEYDIEYEYRYVRPDGAVRAVLGRNVVHKDRTGKAVRFSGTSLDITERKASEDALRAALHEVKTLRGYLRLCANCKRVQSQDGTWEQLESYVRRHTEAEFSHGICPDCAVQWTGSSSLG